jgi:hypothetical protein
VIDINYGAMIPGASGGVGTGKLSMIAVENACAPAADLRSATANSEQQVSSNAVQLRQ